MPLTPVDPLARLATRGERRAHSREDTMTTTKALVLSCALLALAGPLRAVEVEVVTTLPTYAALAREVGGERVHALAISRTDEDAHFVKPKPSLALMLRGADLFVTTGLDLELWAPVLVDKSGNARIRDGQPGYVSASRGVPLLEVPANASRAGGDIHVYGNPHIGLSPLNAKLIAANIAAGLERVDPAGAATYRRNLESFRRRVDEAFYGKQLLAVLDSGTLDPLARSGTLVEFLRGRSYQGQPLLSRLGGWLGRGMAFRGRPVVAYHKSLPYFSSLFGLRIVGYMEPKPGIPPSARHVHDLLTTMEREGVTMIVAHEYTDPRPVDQLAQRTGATVLVLPLEAGGTTAPDYFALMNLWVGRLAGAATSAR
jgi:ABC-type Zn uptake system ZnuABC Zn-binding protein ZnuA